MGYETTEYYMCGIKVPEKLKEFKELYFNDAISLFAEIDATYLGEEDKIAVQNLREFWEPRNEWYDFEQAINLSIRYSVDARVEVNFIFIGEDTPFRRDDQTKNQVAESIK